MHEYEAIIYNVVDGDTMDFEIDLGFGIRYDGRLRLWGVDTPEVRGDEREEGLRVKAYVKELCEGQDVILKTKKWQGKYGRYVAAVWIKGLVGNGYDLGSHLVQKGMAKVVNY